MTTSATGSVATSDSDGARRRRLTVSGVVQGVGFRPFVHRLAGELQLSGSVCNGAEGVVVEVEGSLESLEEFERRLVEQAPPMSRVESVDITELSVTGESGFHIGPSHDDGIGTSPVALVPADTACCADCLRETLDPTDRRARYPFTACTYCGPRFTMVTGLPYDRPFTTMAGFPLCPLCQQEYDDPADRRFHAQPTACPECGPSLYVPRAAHESAGRGRRPGARVGSRRPGRRWGRRRQGSGGLSPCLRRHPSGRGLGAASTQAALGQAVRGSGAHHRRRAAAGRTSMT